jgi:hypothetical protein
VSLAIDLLATVLQAFGRKQPWVYVELQARKESIAFDGGEMVQTELA